MNVGVSQWRDVTREAARTHALVAELPCQMRVQYAAKVHIQYSFVIYIYIYIGFYLYLFLTRV